MNIITEFCNNYSFPENACAYLDKAFSALCQNNECYERFTDFVGLYEENYEFDSDPVFAEIEKMGEVLDVKPYTLDLIYLISLTPHLKKLYLERNISEDIFDRSVLDLKSKNRECFDVYGYYGIFVAWWTVEFFKLKRFGIGRLQFNRQYFDRDIETPFFSKKKGDLYIEVHIPSGEPLDHSSCINSYNEAYSFFKDDFGEDPVVFGCYSWLMSENNRKMLPNGSNILSFMEDYTVLMNQKDGNNTNLWRIFGVFELPENLDDLPGDTSLQRSVIEWLKQGNSIDVGFGIIIMP